MTRERRPISTTKSDDNATPLASGDAMMADPAIDRVLNQIHHGMRVVDATGETIGNVDYIKMGDPGAATVDSVAPSAPGLLEAFPSGGEPDVPEPLRSRLLRQGYLKVDGKGWIDTDRYVPADEIGRVAGDIVRLTVAKDQLLAEM